MSMIYEDLVLRDVMMEAVREYLELLDSLKWQDLIRILAFALIF